MRLKSRTYKSRSRFSVAALWLTRNIFVIIFSGIAIVASAVNAGPVTSGFNDGVVPKCDDCYVDAGSLGFPVDFFGQIYTSAYISNNGYITFNAGQSQFTPTGLTASYSGNPIIAAFYADVDTDGAGSVTYGSGTYNGFDAFGATWNNVGYYPSAIDKLDTFQEIFVSRPDIGAGDFDIVLNYDQIQWEAGAASGGVDGLGGTSAAVGYANGSGQNGTYYQLAGSLMPGFLVDGGTDALVSNTNDGVPGQYEFAVVNGNVTPISAAPEPTAWALMISGLVVIGTGFRLGRCRELQPNLG